MQDAPHIALLVLLVKTEGCLYGPVRYIDLGRTMNILSLLLPLPLPLTPSIFHILSCNRVCAEKKLHTCSSFNCCMFL